MKLTKKTFDKVKNRLDKIEGMSKAYVDAFSANINTADIGELCCRLLDSYNLQKGRIDSLMANEESTIDILQKRISSITVDR